MRTFLSALRRYYVRLWTVEPPQTEDAVCYGGTQESAVALCHDNLSAEADGAQLLDSILSKKCVPLDLTVGVFRNDNFARSLSEEQFPPVRKRSTP